MTHTPNHTEDAAMFAPSTEFYPGQEILWGGALRHIGQVLRKGLLVLAECGTIVSIGQVEHILED